MSKIFPKIHNEGYKFIIIFAIATIILYFINGFLGFIGLVLTIWCYYFFRDPERVSIGDDNYLTSPADGVVLQVMDTTGPKDLGLENKEMKKIGPRVPLINSIRVFGSKSIKKPYFLYSKNKRSKKSRSARTVESITFARGGIKKNINQQFF